MKKLSKNISPFLLLTIPFFAALALMAVYEGGEMIQDQIRISASFIKLPEIDIFRVFLGW